MSFDLDNYKTNKKPSLLNFITPFGLVVIRTVGIAFVRHFPMKANNLNPGSGF